jgi:hypothetical protein
VTSFINIQADLLETFLPPILKETGAFYGSI